MQRFDFDIDYFGIKQPVIFTDKKLVYNTHYLATEKVQE